MLDLFYRKKLARRLLFDKSANDEHERSILTKLKQQCGGQFTSKMEGMVTDLTVARDHQTKFEEFVADHPESNPGVDLAVTVLTTGFWPTYKTFDINLPSEMVSSMSISVHDTKRLTFTFSWEIRSMIFDLSISCFCVFGNGNLSTLLNFTSQFLSGEMCRGF